jgi:ABC-type uncharacterized transport system YnjBCD ATPase subunit
MVMNCPEALEPDPGIGLLDLAQPSGTAKPSLFSWVIGPARQPGVLGERRFPERETHNKPTRG